MCCWSMEPLCQVLYWQTTSHIEAPVLCLKTSKYQLQMMWGLQALENLVCTAGTAFPLSRSLLFALKCPQAPLLLCTSCPWVFAALAPCLSGHSEMWPLDTHNLPSCSSCHRLSGEEPEAAQGELSANQHDLVWGVQSWSVNPWKAHLGEAWGECQSCGSCSH